MTDSLLTPDSIPDFQSALRHAAEQGGRTTVCGSQSKTRVRQTAATAISTTSYAGIVDHQASDFTIATRAGTLVRDIRDELAQAGQYLPFDPTFVDRDATVGGLVASGLNGPCRLRYGGIRDFIIGCQFLDGNATTVRGGGRVVKNAAGFDIPKFLVGSAGRFGLLLEVTFKVFPRPQCYRTLQFETADLAASVDLVQSLNKMLDFEAIDIVNSTRVLARISGENESVIHSATEELRLTTHGFETLSDEADKAKWSDFANFRTLADADLLFKVPMTPRQIALFDQQLASATVRYSAAGNVALVQLPSLNELPAFESALKQTGLAAQMIVGPSDLCLLGEHPGLSYLQKIKTAIDPSNLFGSLNSSMSGVAT